MNNQVIYCKEKKISIPSLKIKLDKIKVLSAEKLSIYQKYTILLLKNGIEALNKDELINKISITLNIKNNFIDEFITLLFQFNYINYDEEKNIYILSDDCKYTIDNNGIMESNTKFNDTEINDVYYLDLIDKFVYKDYFENTNITNKKIENNLETDDLYSAIKNKIYKPNYKEQIIDIIKKDLENKNFVLVNNLTYNLSKEYEKYNIFIDTLVYYKYENGISQKIETKCNLDINQELIDDLSEKYEIDEKLPRFITLKNIYYNAYDNNIENLKEYNKGYNELQNKISELEENIILEEKSLNNEKQKLIKINNFSINPSAQENLIDYLSKSIEIKKEQKMNLQNSLKDHEKEQNKLCNEQENLFQQNIESINKVIVGTIKKYSKTNKLKIIITSFLNRVDEALSASDNMCNTELEYSIQMLKQNYNHIIKIIYEYFIKNQEEDLYSYYCGTLFGELKNTFKSKGIKKELFDKMKYFHLLCNNIESNCNDDSDKIQFNIENFMKKNKLERENILLSVVYFLNNLSISKEDLKNIEKNFIF